MNSGCDSLKNRPPATRLATMYTNQAYLPKEVCPVKIMSINRVHEVFGHFFSSVFDKNEYTHNNIDVSLAKVYLLRLLYQNPFCFIFLVGTAFHGSSGQGCFGYRPFNSFFTC